MKKIFAIKPYLPFLLLFGLLYLLVHALFFGEIAKKKSTLVGQTLPNFHLKTLNGHHIFTPADLLGKVSLINIWASWCEACALELPMLVNIQKQYHIPIYSILYKDDAQNAKKLLNRYGNPFILIANDSRGETAIDLGLYGVPETFIVNTNGKIIYKHIGLINQHNWDNILLPLIKKNENL